jgi:hypothetical protein
MGNGILSKIMAWLQAPAFIEDAQPIDWFALVVVLVIAGFLWSKVVRSIGE